MENVFHGNIFDTNQSYTKQAHKHPHPHNIPHTQSNTPHTTPQTEKRPFSFCISGMRCSLLEILVASHIYATWGLGNVAFHLRKRFSSVVFYENDC